jgi:hypothetical protein
LSRARMRKRVNSPKSLLVQMRCVRRRKSDYQS